jgi:hypothetical protein
MADRYPEQEPYGRGDGGRYGRSERWGEDIERGAGWREGGYRRRQRASGYSPRLEEDDEERIARGEYEGPGYGGYGGGYGERSEWERDYGRGRYGQPRSYPPLSGAETTSGGYQPSYPQRSFLTRGRWPAPGRFTGRGPKGYMRSDERVLEDINDRLTDHPELDATEIEVKVNNCDVTLTGAVDSREAKHIAEEIAESVSGVRNVQNNLRIEEEEPTRKRGGRTQ